MGMRSAMQTTNKIQKALCATVIVALACAFFVTQAQAAASCSSRADIWFANDESGSVSAAEFVDSLNYLYQVSAGLFSMTAQVLRRG